MPITKASGQAVAPAAKGDLVVGSATNDAAVLGVGSANQVLTVDSSTTTGLKWATASAGAGNLVQVASGSLSGASVTISSLSSYTELLLFIYDVTNATGSSLPYFRINGNTGNNYSSIGYWSYAVPGWGRFKQLDVSLQYMSVLSIDENTNLQAYAVRFFNCKNAGFTTYDITTAGYTGSGQSAQNAKGVYKVSEAVSSILFANLGGNWTAGSYILWGA